MNSAYTKFASFLEKKFRFDAHYFLSGGFWLTLGQGITILFGILTTALFAHFLNEVDYGVYKYLIAVAVLFSSLSLTGLGQSIIQTVAKKYYGFYQQTLLTNFLYSLPIAIGSLGASTYYYLNDNPTLATGCLLVAILQPLINTLQFIPAFLLGACRYKESTTLHTARVIVVTIASLGTLFVTSNILWLFAAYLAAQLLTNLGSHLYFRPAASAVPQEITHRYLQYAKHTSLRNLVSNIAHRSDTIIVFTQLGAIELALYSIATVIPEQIKGSFKNLSLLLMPKYAQQNDINKLKLSVPKRSIQLFLLLTAITGVYIIAAPYLYGLLFPKYPDAVLYSQLASLAFPTFILFIPYSILQSQLEESVLYKITMYTSVFQVVILVILVSFFGLTGAIIARLIYRIKFLLIVYWYTYNI